MSESISIAKIQESPTNPRKHFGDLGELVASIATLGVLSPILVRPVRGKGYECVFGHRRLRAAKEAKLEVIPAQVRELTDDEVFDAQLIENVQREDMHPLEEAAAYIRASKSWLDKARLAGQGPAFVRRVHGTRDALGHGRLSVTDRYVTAQLEQVAAVAAAVTGALKPEHSGGNGLNHGRTVDRTPDILRVKRDAAYQAHVSGCEVCRAYLAHDHASQLIALADRSTGPEHVVAARKRGAS